MSPVVGRYFGKCGEQLDWYGRNLLPGHGYCSLHNKLQLMTQAMMKIGGMHSTAEAVNFLVDKIGMLHHTLIMSATT